MRVSCFGVLILLTATACGSDGATSAPQSTNKTIDVVTSGETFLPTIQTVSPGDTVRWTFSTAADGHGHNVLFDHTVAGAPPSIVGEVFSGTRSLVFTTKGDFNYVCALHGGMTGEIIVQ